MEFLLLPTTYILFSANMLRQVSLKLRCLVLSKLWQFQFKKKNYDNFPGPHAIHHLRTHVPRFLHSSAFVLNSIINKQINGWWNNLPACIQTNSLVHHYWKNQSETPTLGRKIILRAQKGWHVERIKTCSKWANLPGQHYPPLGNQALGARCRIIILLASNCIIGVDYRNHILNQWVFATPKWILQWKTKSELQTINSGLKKMKSGPQNFFFFQTTSFIRARKIKRYRCKVPFQLQKTK